MWWIKKYLPFCSGVEEQSSRNIHIYIFKYLQIVINYSTWVISPSLFCVLYCKVLPDAVNRRELQKRKEKGNLMKPLVHLQVFLNGKGTVWIHVGLDYPCFSSAKGLKIKYCKWPEGCRMTCGTKQTVIFESAGSVRSGEIYSSILLRFNSGGHLLNQQ